MALQPNTSVDQIFDALRVIGGAGEPVRVADLARALDLPTSTAHRLLATLQDAGFAARDSTGVRYELGIRAFELVHRLFGQYGLPRASELFIRRLVAVTGETAALDVRVGWYAVRMAGLEGTREIHVAPRIGQTVRLGDSAGGRAILATVPEAIGRYARWAALNRPARRRLDNAVGVIAEHGFAHVPAAGGCAAELAFPIGLGGGVAAAISIEGTCPAIAATPRTGELKRCRTIVAELESMVASDPMLAHDPFAHLDPDGLELAVPQLPA